MEEERPTGTNNLVFAVNGQRFELSSVDPSLTLLEFLRSHTRFKSVKLSCGEGSVKLYSLVYTWCLNEGQLNLNFACF